MSTIPNSRAAAWSPAKQRFMRSRNSETPGPGAHNPSDYAGGVYLLSNFRNHGTHQMKPESRARSRGQMSEKFNTPGPGTY